MPFVKSIYKVPIILIAENTNRQFIADDIRQGVDLFVNSVKELARQNIKYDDYTYLEYWVSFYSLGICTKSVTQKSVQIDDLDIKDISFDNSVNLNDLYYMLDSELSEIKGAHLQPQIVFFVDSTLQHFHNFDLCESLLKNYAFFQSQKYVCCFGDGNPDNLTAFHKFVDPQNIKNIGCNADIESLSKTVCLKCEPIFGYDGTIEQYRRYRQYTVQKGLSEILQDEEARRLIDNYEKEKITFFKKSISDEVVKENWAEDW